ncbi:PA14 domain-containing protein [Leptospira sp. 'Mane']|uniref:PA14 domain-containing protein n=1 Tax=Leptospira sp. 'Mane' TaxID=3387407 RepID=UPI00398AFA78
MQITKQILYFISSCLPKQKKIRLLVYIAISLFDLSLIPQTKSKLVSEFTIENGWDDFVLWEIKNGLPVIAGIQYQTGFLSFLSPTEQGFIGNVDARYFSEPEFKKEILSRKENIIYFPYGGDSFSSDYEGDTFGARWIAKIKPSRSEKYKFITRTDDGVRLWVDGKLIIDQWKDMGTTEFSGETILSSGKEYDLKMEYYDRGGDAYAELLWESPSFSKSTIRKIGSLDYGYALINPFGTETNWETNYFKGKEFKEPISKNKTEVLNFTSNTEPFANGVPLENFCARFSSSIRVPVTGDYTFFTTSDDGVRLKLGNQTLIDQWTWMGPTEFSETVKLKEGEIVPIEIEYFQGGGGKFLKLEWQGPGFQRTLLGTKGKKERFSSTVSLPLYPGKIFVHDLNSDGKNDLVFTHPTYSGKVSIAFQNQFGFLKNPIEYKLGKDPNEIIFSDLDNDLDADIIVRSKSENQFHILWNEGESFRKESASLWKEPIQNIKILPSYSKPNPNESPYIIVKAKNDDYAKLKWKKPNVWTKFESLSSEELKEAQGLISKDLIPIFIEKKCIGYQKKEFCYDKSKHALQTYE